MLTKLAEYALSPKPWAISVPPQFLADHLRMEDVRLYGRDLLQEYSALQRFTPFRSEGAHCFNWARMLAEFGYPMKSPNYVRTPCAANVFVYISISSRSTSCLFWNWLGLLHGVLLDAFKLEVVVTERFVDLNG